MDDLDYLNEDFDRLTVKEKTVESSGNECCACYGDEGSFKCSDIMCTFKMCQECMRQYIDVCLEQKSILGCVGENCKGVYISESLSLLPNDLFKRAMYATFAYFTQSKTVEMSEKAKAEAVKKTLLDQRMQFYTENMPKAVLTVANTIFARKLKKVSKDQISKAKKSKTVRVCINLFCKGYLDEDFLCGVCDTKFCKMCEEVEKEDHVCDEDQLQSVQFIKNVMACPNCDVKIEKSQGCMAMTCAVCGTNFWYNSGQLSEVGNHGQSIPVKILLSRRLSTEYHEVIPEKWLRRIRILEGDIESKSSGETSFIEYLYRIKDVDFTTWDREKLRSLEKFFILYSKMYKYKSDMKNINAVLMALETVLKENESDLEKKIHYIFDKYKAVLKCD